MIIENSKLQRIGKDIQLSANITFASRKSDVVFFSVDSKYASFIKDDASPFLACLLLPAMKLKEDIYIDATISQQLLVNTQKIMRLVVGWNIGLKKIKIIAKSTTNEKKKNHGIGSFFSGGVDSFSTYLINKGEPKDAINHFIFVHGFDIFLKENVAFDKVYKTLKAVAKEENIELISVKTNIREITDPILEWGYVHGGALASIALFLSNGFTKIHIPSTFSTGHLFPWGSHPALDPLWSTENVQIIHDSSHLSRQQKIKSYISKSSVALKYLRVCWSSSEYNCGQCSKCIRTMLALQVTNSLHKSKTFPTKLKPEIIRNFFLTNKSQIVFFEELLLELKKEKGDQETQDAIAYMLKKSSAPDIKRKIRSFVSLLDKKFNNDRLFWYLSKKGVARP